MLYHLALARDWADAQVTGDYRVSTRGVTLAAAGFVHTSRRGQVRGVAETFYAGVTEPLVLLQIDEDRLSAPWRVDPVPGSAEGFPHVYGPIDLAAVVAVGPVRREPDGTWVGFPPGV